MSWYFFGGFSAYAMVPSGRGGDHSGGFCTPGWVGGDLRGEVGAVVEPLRVLVHPGMVRRALQGEVQRDLQTLPGGLLHEPVEVLDRAQVRVDGVVAALRRADRPRHTHIVRTGGQGVVAALAE